jgi:hypothetical protein
MLTYLLCGFYRGILLLNFVRQNSQGREIVFDLLEGRRHGLPIVCHARLESMQFSRFRSVRWLGHKALIGRNIRSPLQ